MDKKNISYNYVKASAENKQNSQQDFTVEFAKDNTFDQINLTHSEGSKNKGTNRKDKDAEFATIGEAKTNNKKYTSRNKKDDRKGKRNRENKN